MGAKEFEVSFKGLLFNRGRVKTEINWKLVKIMTV